MLNPFIEVISSLIGLINIVLLIWIVLNLLIQFSIVNAYQPLIARIKFILDQLMNPLLRPIRRFIPMLGGLDLSPLVLIFALQFIDSAMYHWLWDL